jgi:predicted transcriptional regulator
MVSRDEQDIVKDYVYKDQDIIGRKIMEYSGWYGNRKAPMPVNVIATLLKISPAAVSQRRGKIQDIISNNSDLK